MAEFTSPKTDKLPSSIPRSKSGHLLKLDGEDIALHEAVAHFLDESDNPLENNDNKEVGVSGKRFHATCGGVQNQVVYVSQRNVHGEDEIVGVLRVSKNENDNLVSYEHALLEKISQQGLSFNVPSTIPSVDGDKPYVKLESNGACASLFKYIPGDMPSSSTPENARALGKCLGELSVALAKIPSKSVPPCPNFPAIMLYKAHPAVTRDKFFEVLEGSAFDECRASTQILLTALGTMEQKIHALDFVSLPRQLTHGDLHCGNVLMVGDAVTGVLDFEKCTVDFRAMDLTKTLARYAVEPDPMVLYQPFIDGFMEHVTMTSEEINALPSLVVMRILFDAVNFVGKSISGEDSISMLTSRMDTYSKRIAWVVDHSDDICSMLTTLSTARAVQNMMFHQIHPSLLKVKKLDRKSAMFSMDLKPEEEVPTASPTSSSSSAAAATDLTNPSKSPGNPSNRKGAVRRQTFWVQQRIEEESQS